MQIHIDKGAHLASATVPWHWLFFCPAPKVRANFGRAIAKSLKSPQWHWLILAQMCALAYYIHIPKVIFGIYFLLGFSFLF